MKKIIAILNLFLLITLIGRMSFAYDQVVLKKVVPLVIKKAAVDGLRIGPKQEIWSLDSDENVLRRISIDGKITETILGGKKETSLFRTPVDFTFSAKGQLWVSDSGLNRVASMALDNKKPVLVFSFPVENPGPLAVSAGDVIAVANTKLKDIQVYSSDGILLHTLFSPANQEFKSLTALRYSIDGVLWVLDGSAGKLHRFSPERKWLGVTDQLGEANNLDVDEFGFAYVSLAEGRWKEINSQGKIIGTFGAKGKNPGQMSNPTGLALMDEFSLWVADKNNNRLELFEIKNSEKKNRLTRAPAARIQIKNAGSISLSVPVLTIQDNNKFLVINSKGQLQWLDQTGKVELTFDKKSKTKSGFIEPGALSRGKNGDIWVSDTGDNNLKMVTSEGDIKKIIGKKGKKEGELLSPSFISVRDDESIIVVDKGESRIQVLSKEGLFLFSVGGKKEKNPIKKVVGLAGNEFGFAVLEGEKKSLMFFDSNGKFLSEVTNKPNATPTWRDPVSLTTDAHSDYLILDKEAGRLRVFDPKGKYLADVSVSGNSVACGVHDVLYVVGEKSTRLLTMTIIPRALDNIKVEEEGGYLKLTWDLSSYAKTYHVYRSSASNSYELLLSTPTSGVVDLRIIPSVSYQYAVVGVAEGDYEGNWAFSNTVKAPKRTDTSLISISSVTLNPLFTAAFKYYVDHPFGTITLINNSDRLYRNVKVTLTLKNYSDFSTEKVIDEIPAGQSKSIPLTLTLNEKVLEINENTPVQAEVHVSYFEDNAEKTISQNAPMMLYSRNAIMWSDKNRIASFITPKDPPIVEFSRSAIKEFLASLKSSTVGKPLAKATLLYESLNALNMTYVPDPKTPFNEVSAKPDILDYVQFPRETLRRKTGDCDDTTALLASLLTSIGVDVALVDMPTHVLLMIDTEENDPWVLGLPVERFIEFKGTYWVPIETTALGKNFNEAWQNGIAKIKTSKEAPNYIPIMEAQSVYPPVTILEKEDSAVSYPKEKVKEEFSTVLDKLQKERYKYQLDQTNKLIAKNPQDGMLKIQLGMVHFEGQNIVEAKKVFEDLLKTDDPDVLMAAQNNLGNLSYLEGDYKKAETYYNEAGSKEAQDGGVLINRARCSWKLNNSDEAKNFLYKAKEILPNWTEFVTDFPAELLPN